MPLNESPLDWVLAVHPLTIEELLNEESLQTSTKWEAILDFSAKQAKSYLIRSLTDKPPGLGITDAQIDADDVETGGSGQIQVGYELLISYFVLKRYSMFNYVRRKLGRNRTNLGTESEIRKDDWLQWLQAPEILHEKALNILMPFTNLNNSLVYNYKRGLFDWAIDFESFKKC